jgi:transcriptional regulator with XRE-family HTH domain
LGGTVDLVRLGIAIADARRAAGFTQEELARRAGKKQADISKIENGRNEPTLQTLANFARILRIDPVLLAAQAFRD